MKNKAIQITVALLLMFVFTGCYGVNDNFKEIRDTVFGSLKGSFKKDVEFSIGPAGISLAGMFVSFAEPEEPVEEILDKVSKVQVGVYKYRGNELSNVSYSVLDILKSKITTDNWQCILKSRDVNELACVFIRMDDEILNKILVVALDHRELVITEVTGELDELIEIVLKEHKLEIS